MNPETGACQRTKCINLRADMIVACGRILVEETRSNQSYKHAMNRWLRQLRLSYEVRETGAA